MLFQSSASDAVIDQIQADAGVWKPEQLSALLSYGRRQRVADYDQTVRGLSQRYSGDQAAIVRHALVTAYPKTGHTLPVDPVGWLRFFTRQDAGVYTTEATRFLVDALGYLAFWQWPVSRPRANARPVTVAVDEWGPLG